MVLDPDGGSSVPVHIRDLEFETQVLSIQTWGSELESLTFENCHLSAGFHELTGEPSGDARVFRRCRIDGTIGYFVGGSITVDSCDVEGLLHAQHDDCQLTVTYSRFRGSGISSYVGNAHVSDNVFEQGALAIEANLHAVVLNNHVLSGSIYVGSQDGNANVSGNRLEHGSITADVNQNVLLEGNVVLNSESNGMYVLVTSSATITRNLVSGSTRNGFYILGSDPYQLDVTNNTSVFNHGCGFLSEGGFSGGPYYFTGNIGAGNGAYGQEWAGTEVTAIRYNNWFDNALGDVQGLPLSAQDLTVDPLFCDVANGDFQLSAASPLVNASG